MLCSALLCSANTILLWIIFVNYKSPLVYNPTSIIVISNKKYKQISELYDILYRKSLFLD